MKLFWLDEIRHDQTEVGGKALAIAQLRQAGFPVPNGFVINDLVLAQKKALVIANTHQDSEAFSKSELKPNDKKRIQKNFKVSFPTKLICSALICHRRR